MVLPCACRVRTFSRRDLVALVGRDVRLHLIGLRRELWCGDCHEAPFTGWWSRSAELDPAACGRHPEPAEPQEAHGMCGRFTQHYIWAELHALLDLIGPPRNLRPRHNIAPTTNIDVVRSGKAGRELDSMRWGLIPAWWKKSAKEVPATLNARAETVAEKPMFRDAFKRRRCIIPASGFYEWTGDRKDRQPHLFTAADGAPVLAFAGLWDR
jgi:hypothetical protein